MEPETVQAVFQVRKPGETFGSVALMEDLLIEWEDGQWKVTYPMGHESWIGRASHHHAAILNYLKSRLGVAEY